MLTKIVRTTFQDSRGSFTSISNSSDEIGARVEFVMDNVSTSKRGVLRGLHYQEQYPQGKLITVLQGAIYDVVVDLRKESQYFGKWEATEMSPDRTNQLWVPPGYAHGFLALEEKTIVHYKTTNYYYPDDQRILAWDDTDLSIPWPRLDCDYILSDRDQAGEPFTSTKEKLLSA